MKRLFYIILFLLFYLNLLFAENNVIEYRLDNGLTVLLKPIKKVPIVTVQIWVKCGSITETEYPGSGISHYIEHLLFTSTKKHSTVEIAQKVKSLGCDMNGYTSFEQTVYHWTLPSENILKILPIIKEMIFEPGFKEAEIKKEKEVILKEINMNNDDPDRFFNALIFESVYEKANYRFPIIGYKELFMKLTKRDILNYYNRMYVPDNIALIIAGDFEIDKIKEEIIKNFGALPAKIHQPVILIEEPKSVGYREVKKFGDDIKLTRVAYAFKTVDIRHPDLFALDVLALIMGKGKSSILSEILKEQKRLVQSISAFSYTPIGNGIFTIEAELPDYQDIERLKNELFPIFDNIKKFITEKDVQKAKKMVLAEHYQSLETVEANARDLGINWVSTGNINFSSYYVENIKKVKLQDIVNVVKKYITRDNLTFIVLANSKNKETGHSIEKSESSFKEFKLKNGMKILLNKDTNVPVVSICLTFKGGQLFEKETKLGLTYFLSKMLTRGTKKYSRKEISGFIESNGGSINTYAGNNSFGITINILKEDIKLALEILSEIVKNATFPKNEIEKVKQLILNEIKQQEEELFIIGKKIMFKEVYKDYGYKELNTGNPDSIVGITYNDIMNHYKFLVRPENSVLSISGDYSKQTEEWIKEYFQDYSVKTDEDIIEPEYRIPDITEPQLISTNVNKEQTLLLIAFYGIDVRDNEREKSELLWQILNGQGSRLFVAVREKKGLVYYTGMFPFYGLTTGLFVFYAGTVVEKVDAVKKEILNEIEKLVKSGVTEAELQSAKREAKATKLREFQSNNSISFNFALDKLYMNKVKTIEEYNNIIDAITLNDLNDFIKKFLDTHRYYVIIVKGVTKK